MTEHIATIVQQGSRYRVALFPVSFRGGSPIVAASWAEQDNQVFEAENYSEAEAFVGQMPERYWSAESAFAPEMHSAARQSGKSKAKARR